MTRPESTLWRDFCANLTAHPHVGWYLAYRTIAYQAHILRGHRTAYAFFLCAETSPLRQVD